MKATLFSIVSAFFLCSPAAAAEEPNILICSDQECVPFDSVSDIPDFIGQRIRSGELGVTASPDTVRRILNRDIGGTFKSNTLTHGSFTGKEALSISHGSVQAAPPPPAAGRFKLSPALHTPLQPHCASGSCGRSFLSGGPGRVGGPEPPVPYIEKDGEQCSSGNCPEAGGFLQRMTAVMEDFIGMRWLEQS